jgi:cellulose biosynthesis protein BcsQ
MALVAVVSGKGGGTKTTTVYALGSAMRELGEAPVLVDLDPGASLTDNSGLIPDGNHARDFLEGRASLEALLAQTVSPSSPEPPPS